MENPRVPLPGQSRPQRLGQPYHGLLIDGVLTLSTGRKITWPGAPYGDCYRFAVPGVPTVNLPSTELALETAAGREWRNAALLTGVQRNYGGIIVGANAWLYAAPDGTVWRIECPELGMGVQSVTPPPGVTVYGSLFPGTLDFHFSVRRFGVVSPDADDAAATISRVVTAQSLGGEWVGDYVNTPPVPEARRRNPFNGDEPEMPINIEDINSTGSQVLVGVNRTVEQSALPPINGRAWPYAWLMITVTGAGDDIAISMSVEALQTVNLSWDHLDGPALYSGYWVWDADAETRIYQTGGGLPDAPYINYATGSWTRGELICGLYFDDLDAVSRVTVEPTSGHGISQGQVEWGPDTMIALATRSVSQGVSEVTIVHGEHSVSFPSLTCNFSETIPGTSQLTLNGGVLEGTYSDIGVGYGSGWFNPFEVTGESHIGPGVPFVKYSGLVEPEFIFSALGSDSLSYYGAVVARAEDGVCVVRVTNKVFAVICRRPTMNFNPTVPGDYKVLAIGSPAGWMSGPSVAQMWKASYNPITHELAVCEASHSRGWV